MQANAQSSGLPSPRVYPRTAASKISLFITGAALVVLGVASNASLREQVRISEFGGSLTLNTVAIGLLAVGTLIAVYARRSRIVLDRDEIMLVGLSTRSLHKKQIAGVRTMSKGKGRVLEGLPGFPTLELPNKYAFDDAFEKWIGRFDDLDERDEAADEKAADEAFDLAVRTDQRLGATPEVRERRLVQAGRASLAINGAGLAAGLAGLFFPWPSVVLMSVLLLYPLGVLVLIWATNGLYRMDTQRFNARPNVGYGVFFSGFGLAAQAVAYAHVFDWVQAISAAILGSLLFTGLVMAADAEVRARRGAIAVWLIASLAAGYGALAFVNRSLDGTASITHRSKVVKKETSGSSKRKKRQLVIAPWGPFAEELTYNVGILQFEEYSEGSEVCFVTGKGLLGMAWYDIASCTPDDE